jgi:glycosyltransferase involved in cell wall biosynthesis
VTADASAPRRAVATLRQVAGHIDEHLLVAGSQPITCVVLALNEELNIDHALWSLKPAGQVVVVDSGSADRTREIVERHGAVFVRHPWEGYARQRNWALDLPEIANEWVLFIDADEAVPSEAWREIAEFLHTPRGARAASFRRTVHMFGRPLRHGGFSTARVTRLLQRSHCHFIDREVHEHAVVDGRIHRMAVPLVHRDRKPFGAWLERHNWYSSLEAEARLRPPASAEDLDGARGMKQWVRTRLWPKLPAKPLLFFLYVYVVRLGFLDGRAGLRISALYGMQELAVQIKLEELRTAENESTC